MVVFCRITDLKPRVVSGTADVYTYFYTMIKVFEYGSTTQIYESIMHQRDFLNSFSIHNAAAVGEGILQQGKKYEVRLFYFIPPISGTVLEMEVPRIEFSIVRVRE